MEDKLNGNKRKNQYSKENLNKKLEIFTEKEKNNSDIKENNDLNLKEVKITKKVKNKNKEIDDEEISSEADNEKELEFQELLKNFNIKNYGSKDYLKLPHKSFYRMRAHCNPLSDLHMSL